MNCKKAEKWLADRALGFLTPGQERSLMEHVGTCAHCQTQAKQYQQVTQVLQTHVSERMAFNITDRVLSHAQSTKPKGWFSMKWAMPAAMGAVALLVVGLMPMMFSTQSITMTQQEVLQSYTEDLATIGISNEATTEETSEFSYETYGIPTVVSQYMN